LKSVVTKGENKGKSLSHENVCRVYQSKALQNKLGQVKIPMKGLSLNNNFSLVGFAQQKGTLRVLAVANCITL
jgi:hypothetical protein